ncbi:MAG: MTAP family purine nucleoside phosphorylase [Euryarchaeota archaeon]|nr:MTAP family purine nucleoside phosphorylase [Euryarchaeota archaeon]
MALRLGIVGGTGFYGLPKLEPVDVETPFGDVALGRTKLGGREAFFVPRHGGRHERPPHLVNHRANVHALASAHCDYVLGVFNAGSLVKGIRPGSWAVLGDFLDFHRSAPRTFFADRAVHVDFSEPVCPHASDALSKAAPGAPRVVYAGLDGPRFETPAEVRMLAGAGAQVVGMTAVPEATLAHERGLCYAGLVFVGNHASGVGRPAAAQEIQALLGAQRRRLLATLDAAARGLPTKKSCRCAKAPGCADLTLEAKA